MPADVKSQFADLSGKVSKGAEGVIKSLKNMTDAAGKADKAFDKLSKTQKTSLKIAKDFDKTTDSLVDGLKDLGKVSKSAAKSFAGLKFLSASKNAAGLAASLKAITSTMKSTDVSAGDVADSIKKLGVAGKNTTDDVDVLDTTLMSSSSAMSLSASSADGLTKKLKLVSSAAKNASDSTMFVSYASLEAGSSNEAFWKSALKVANAEDMVASKTKRATEATLEAAKTGKDFTDEYRKVDSILGLLKGEFAKGQEEAQEFAKGLGASGTGLVAAGVAAVYFSGKLSEVLDEFQDAATGLAKFNINTALMNKTIAMSGPSLESMRKQLKLTREQASEYFKVVKEGTNILGMTPAAIMEVSKSLQDAFGGDPTSRLKDYIDLLKDIPSLDTDLKVTASFDRQSAALFALAEKGKVETVIELQAAGLLGGGKMEFGTDKTLLNAQQKTQGTMQGIQDAMLSFYPKWGPQFTAIATSSANLFKLTGNAVGMLGAYKIFFSKGNAAEKGTLLKAEQIKVDTGIIAKTTTAEEIKGDSAGGGIGGKFGKIGMTLGGIAVGLELAGLAADSLSDHFENTGDTISKDGAKLSSSLLKIGASAATGAMAGTYFAAATGGWSIAIGGAIGATVGLIQEFDNLKTSVSEIKGSYDASKNEVEKYQTALENTREKIQKTGNSTAPKGKHLGEYGTVVHSINDEDYNKWESTTSKAIDNIYEVSATLMDMDKPSRDFIATMEAASKENTTSALALSVIMSKLEKETKSEIFRLLDFNRKLANIKMDALMNAGGSAESFSFAITESSEALSKKLRILSDVFVETRDSISKDNKIIGNQRKQGLQELHEKELEAAKEFAEGISKVVDALFKSPAIIQAGLKGELAKRKTEVPMESGALSKSDIFKTLAERGAAAAEEVKGLQDAFTEARKKLNEADESFGKREEMRIDSVKAEAKNIPGLLEKMVKKGVLTKTTTKDESGKTEEKFNINKEGISSAIPEFQEKAEELAKSLEKLGGSIHPDTPVGASLALAQLDTSINNTKTSIKQLEDQLSKAPASDKSGIGKRIEEETKLLQSSEKQYKDKLSSVSKTVNDALTNFAKGKDPSKIIVKEFDPDKYGKMMTSIGKTLQDGGDFDKTDFKSLAPDSDPTGESTKKEMTYIYKAMLASLGKNKEDVKRLVKETKEYGAASEELEIVKGLAEEWNLNTVRLKSLNDAQEKYNAGLRKVGLAIVDTSKVMESDEIKNLETQLDVANDAAAWATKLGDPTQATLDAMSKEVELFSEKYSTAHEALIAKKKELAFAEQYREQQEKEVKMAQSAFDAAGKGSAIEKKAAKEKLDAANASAAQAQVAVGSLRKTVSFFAKTEAEMFKSSQLLPKAGQAMLEALSSFREGIPGQEIQSEFDLSDATMEMSTFSDNTTELAEKARKKGTEAAIHLYKKQQMIIKLAAKSDRNNNAKKILAMKLEANSIQNLEEKAAKLKEIDSTAESSEKIVANKEAIENAKNESSAKKKVAEYGEQEAQTKMQLLNTSESVAEAELSILSSMGSSMSAVLDKQKEIVAIKQKEADAVKAQYEQALAADMKLGKITQNTLNLEGKARLAQLAVTQKTMGVQRDFMEKMMAQAMGAVRTSVGARRQQGTMQSVMGVENTRRKTTAGYFAGAGKEGIKPYWQRLNELRMAGGKGGAERTTPEKELANKMEDVKKGTDATAKAADATASSVSRGDKPGSFYTHDVTAEALLKQILDAVRGTASSVGNISDNSEKVIPAPADAKELFWDINKNTGWEEKPADNSEITAKTMEKKIADITPDQTMEKKTLDNFKTDRKWFTNDKKDTKYLKNIMSDGKLSRKELESIVKGGMDVSEFPKDVSDELKYLQKNYEETGFVSSGIEYLTQKVDEQGKQVAAQNKKDEAKTKNGSKSGFAGATPWGSGKIGGMGGKTYGPGRGLKAKSIEQQFSEMEAGFGSGKGVKSIESSFSGGDFLNAKEQELKNKLQAKQLDGAGFPVTGGVKGAGGGIAKAGGMATTVNPVNKTPADVPSMTGVETSDIATRQRSIGGVSSPAEMYTTKPNATAGRDTSGAAGASSMSVEGKMTVHFDHAMFKTEVTKIVAEVIRGPENIKSLQRSGFVTTNG